MKFTSTIAPVALAGAALAAPQLKERATTICGQWDSLVEGSYTLFQDLWNEQAATSGSQCSTANSLSGSTFSWSTSWTWAGGQGQVKSYANVAIEEIGRELSSISTIPSVWDWSYTGSSIIADVSYDTYLAPSATGTNDYEIMIWLAALGGAGPISSTGSPVATPTIDGHVFNLFSGFNGDVRVFSFVAEPEVTSFNGDLKAFYTYLISDQGVPTTHFLTSIGAGTEPFSGSNAVLTTSAYSLVIN